MFAIAITLLVLTIAQPTDYRHLGAQLRERWPSFAAYAVSFAVIGIMWLNHHTVFSYLDRVDRPLVYLNLALLVTVVFVPYPTGIFGEALRKGEGARVAAVTYSLTMTLNAIAWTALWLYASSRRRLLADTFPEAQRKTATIAFGSGPAFYAASVGVAVVNAIACLIFHGALALYYALDPLSRRART